MGRRLRIEDNDTVSAQKIADVIDKWVIGRNAERDREILKDYFINGICVDGKRERTLTSIHEMSARQIWYIIRKYRYKIFKHLGFYDK